ncbi:MAG: DUF1801 domain-containing protein [Patescibacteria group bacterium]|mgnify:CR=1 FL=1
MNMFAKNLASSVNEYLVAVPGDRKAIIDFMHEFIQKSVPSLKPHFAYNMLGYGSFEYFDKRAKEYKPWPVVALANQKNYVSVYVCAIDGNEYLTKKYADRLGKVNVGKSCIRFKNLKDVNLEALKEVLQKAENSPGLVGAEK